MLSLFFRLNNFIHLPSSFTDSFLYHLHFVIVPIKWILKFHILYFSARIFIWFYFIVSIVLQRFKIHCEKIFLYLIEQNYNIHFKYPCLLIPTSGLFYDCSLLMFCVLKMGPIFLIIQVK